MLRRYVPVQKTKQSIAESTLRGHKLAQKYISKSEYDIYFRRWMCERFRNFQHYQESSEPKC